MGLLDIFDSEQGRLGLGLLAMAGPQARPMGFGERLMGAYGMVDAMRRDKEEAAYKRMVRDRQQTQWAREDKQAALDDEIANLATNFYKPGSPAVAPLMGSALTGQDDGILPSAGRAATSPTFDMKGYASAVMAKSPKAGLPLLQALQKDTQFNKIDPEKFTPASLAKFAQTGNYGDLEPRDKLEVNEGMVFNPFDKSMVGKTLPNPNKPFQLGNGGQIIPNIAYQQYELEKAKAGAANTSVKVENKMGESLAGQIGPMVRETWTAANGAIQTANAANQVLQGAAKGNLFAGPGANVRMTVAQVGDMLGVTGKDTAEKIANTRSTLQGLAQMTLQGRKQMTGQGAITESESKLAERAMSGDITMTAGEIVQLANAARRAAQFTYQQHIDQVGNLDRDPALSGLSRFYKVAPFPAQYAPPTPVKQSAQGGPRFLGFEGQ